MRWISRARAVGGLAQVRRIVLFALLPVAVVGAAGAVAIWIMAPDLSRVFLHGLPHGGGTVDIRIVAPLVPLAALSLCLIDGLRGFGRTWPYLAIEGVGKPVTRIALVVGALLAGLGLHGAIVAWGIPVAVGLMAASVIFVVILSSEVPVTAGPQASGGYRAALNRAWHGVRRRQDKHHGRPAQVKERRQRPGRGVLAVHRPARLPGHLSGDHPLARHPAGRRDCFAARGGCLRCCEQARDSRHVRAGGDPARDKPAGQCAAGPR